MARAAQRLWRASSPLGWTSELGLAGAGPVAILAGFSLAAALELNPASIGTLLTRAQDAFRKEYIKRYGTE